MRPQLKGVAWERDSEQLRLVYDIRDHFVLLDADGTVERLLELLRDGGRTQPELATVLAGEGRNVVVEDVVAAVALLDEHGLLEDGDRLGRLGPGERERYFSNVAFFESFSSLARGREDFQQRLRAAHVLVLGTGGLNSNIIPHLCGLGVGRLTLLDRDVVEPRNFARQYLYRWSDLGTSKVKLAADWARAFDPTIKVEAVDADLAGAGAIAELLHRVAPDAVMSGVDSPVAVDDWVNSACVSRRIPYVRGGMYVTQGIVRSVDPGVSACLDCVADARTDTATEPEERASLALFGSRPRTNRGIGPVAGLLGALCAFEILRYLTRFEPPAHAGGPLVIDFAHGCAMRQVEWPRDPGCATCGALPAPGRSQSGTDEEVSRP
jgi:molybdopterin-synthase adenylyltransferase